AGVCQYQAYSGNGSIHPEGQNEGRHTVEAVLYGTQHWKDIEERSSIGRSSSGRRDHYAYPA
ncbi:unnamed protein product, partial [marine sediment metagenome]